MANAFGSGVKIGNWNEDLYLKEEQLKQFEEKEKAGTLAFQSTQNLATTLKNSLSLSTAQEGQISYGDKLMLIHTESNSTLCSLPSVHAPTDGGVTASCSSTDTTPIKRNVFTILPFKGKSEGDALCYDDSFFLKCEGPTGENLYLFSERPGLSTPLSRYAGEQRAFFVDAKDNVPTFGMAWKCVSADVDYRLEMEGQPIDPVEKFILKHAQSGEALSCNYQQRQKLRTEFGVDHEVTCKTKVNRAHVEEAENVWSFSSGK